MYSVVLDFRILNTRKRCSFSFASDWLVVRTHRYSALAGNMRSVCIPRLPQKAESSALMAGRV